MNKVCFTCNFCHKPIENLEDGQVQWHGYPNGEFGRYEIAHNDCARRDCEWGIDLPSFVSKRHDFFKEWNNIAIVRDLNGYQRMLELRRKYWEAIEKGEIKEIY